ncbi:MAG: alpha/beta hydrolase [Pseudomonadota bacterium]
MNKRTFTALLCLQLLAIPAFSADAPPAANRYAFTLAPAERFEVGATLVERHGKGGAPLILIPGLASGPWVWQEAVRQLMGEHSVYVLTLPGFDGRPAVPGKGLEAARESLRELIASRKLQRPVLIGHSLGGTMALGFAAAQPDLVRGVVSIDGLPLLPGTEDWDDSQRAKVAEGILARPVTTSAVAFAQQQQEYMRGTGVVDMARADEVARLTGRSDPAAVTKYMGEALAVDLRTSLASIKAPVLVVSPYFDVDAEQQRLTEAAKTEYYKVLMAGTPNLQVVSIKPARHFAMIDQPQLTVDAIRLFLKGLPK